MLVEQLGQEPDFIFFDIPGATRIATPRKQGLQLHWLDPLQIYRHAQRIIVGSEAALASFGRDSFDGYLLSNKAIATGLANQRSSA